MNRLFLFRKSTLVVFGFLVLMAIGVGVRWHTSERNKETIKLAETLLFTSNSEFFVGHMHMPKGYDYSGTFRNAEVTYDGPNKRTVHGDLDYEMRSKPTQKYVYTATAGVVVTLGKQQDEWILLDAQWKIYESFWDKITKSK